MNINIPKLTSATTNLQNQCSCKILVLSWIVQDYFMHRGFNSSNEIMLVNFLRQFDYNFYISILQNFALFSWRLGQRNPFHLF